MSLQIRPDEAVLLSNRHPVRIKNAWARVPATGSSGESPAAPVQEPPPAPAAPAAPAELAPAASGTDKSPKTAARPGTKPAPKKPLPVWKVLLHNDDVNTDVFVVRTLMELVRLQPDAAVRVMLEAHQKGVALVMTAHKERAELVREQFASKGLTATIEPDAA